MTGQAEREAAVTIPNRPKGPKPIKAQEAQAKAQGAQVELTGLEKKTKPK